MTTEYGDHWREGQAAVTSHAMLRRYDPRITTPDGRVFRGRWPHTLGEHGEAPYIAALAQQVQGVAEVCLPVGRADVATNTTVFEVEPAASWRTGARQALAYAGMSGLSPALALFGPADYLPIYLRVRDRIPGLTLWIWEGPSWGWRRANRAAATAKHTGLRATPPGRPEGGRQQ